MKSKQELSRERIAQYYEKNVQLGKIHTVRHFVLEGIPRDTVYKIINRYLECGTTATKPGSGRPAKILTPKVLDELKNKFENSDDLSFKKAADQYGCHRTHISRTLKNMFGIKHRKKVKAPKYRDQQQLDGARKQC